mgnify:CR=1 FL=1
MLRCAIKVLIKHGAYYFGAKRDGSYVPVGLLLILAV